jgi:hypothetical protein
VKKLWFAIAIIAALGAVGIGVWNAARDSGPALPAAEQLSARETLERHLAEGRGVAAADWVRGGSIGEGGETGNHARFAVLGLSGRAAVAYLVSIEGTWYLVSLTEGAPQCAAVERYGFPSAMIADCRVGEAQTVAEALAAAIAGEDVSGVRLVGQVALPPDPSCNCVLLTSGGASVRLNISASALAASGIQIGDTVVISGGLGGDLSVDATAVIRSDGSGVPEAITAATGGAAGGGTGRGDDGSGGGGGPRPSVSTPPEPASNPPAPPSSAAPTVSGGTIIVPSLPDWKPRLRYKTSWYANPFDLDSSASDVPSIDE